MGRPDESTYRVTLEMLQRYVDTLVPVGGTMWWPVNSPTTPAIASGLSVEWKECDGSGLDTTTYAALFALLGYTWGGAGSTFNLPDLRGKVAGGDDATTWLTGTTQGTLTHTLTQGELPNVALPVTDTGHGHGVTDPGHVHGITDPQHAHYLVVDSTSDTNHTHQPQGWGSEAPDPGDAAFNLIGTTTASTGITVNSATTGLTVNSGPTGITVATGGSGTAFSIVQPTAVGRYVIRVK